MNNNDYRFGSEDDTGGLRDSRADYRLTAKARAVIELESEDPEGGAVPEDSPRKLAGRVRDLSAGGCCLWLPEPVAISALLPMTIWLGSDVHNGFPLTVEVIWCRPSENGFLVGLHVLASDDTGYVDWVEAVGRAMSGA
ncbi:PilZ domain-containing protein [Marinobacter sp. C2H3]|uniref:PilZ domain-containing protein n=1 Tax=Marinobacter sp. C2H3 TaxID=3119003 RepID=UPI00300F679B